MVPSPKDTLYNKYKGVSVQNYLSKAPKLKLQYVHTFGILN